MTEYDGPSTSGAQWGDKISGEYTLTQSTVDGYSLTETGPDFTLNENGTLSSNTTETGNTVEGSYSQAITGSDTYSMVETGTTGGGSFTEMVTGTDTYTQTQYGNPVNETFDRTIAVTGTYTRTDTGPAPPCRATAAPSAPA